MSRKPRVVSSAQRAPVRSRIVLIATVAPCRKSSVSANVPPALSTPGVDALDQLGRCGQHLAKAHPPGCLREHRDVREGAADIGGNPEGVMGVNLPVRQCRLRRNLGSIYAQRCGGAASDLQTFAHGPDRRPILFGSKLITALKPGRLPAFRGSCDARPQGRRAKSNCLSLCPRSSRPSRGYPSTHSGRNRRDREAFARRASRMCSR